MQLITRTECWWYFEARTDDIYWVHVRFLYFPSPFLSSSCWQFLNNIFLPLTHISNLLPCTFLPSFYQFVFSTVPLDDFLFQENVGLALWGNTSNSSRRSAIRKAALIKEKELEEAPSQIRRAAEDVTYDNDSKVNNSKNTKSRLSSKESDTSDGHTSDGDVSYSTSEGFYYGNYCELDPRELPASSAPDCYPINTRGRGYTTDLLRDDFRIYTRAVLETHVEICDASLHGSISEFARSRVEAGDVSGHF